jgi:hypothetical protein
MPGDLAAAGLMHDHVSLFRAAMMPQPANQPAYRETLAKSLCQFARAEYRCVLALEADRPDVEAGADLVGERGGRSFGRSGHAPAWHENN